jgi:hypothetical protein
MSKKIKMQALYNDRDVNVAFWTEQGLFFLQREYETVEVKERCTMFFMDGLLEVIPTLSFSTKTLEDGIFLSKAHSKDWWDFLIRDYGFKRV